MKKIDREIKVLLNDMLETMYNANGIGLAAPQIKDNRRLIVVDCGFKKGIKKDLKKDLRRKDDLFKESIKKELKKNL